MRRPQLAFRLPPRLRHRLRAAARRRELTTSQLLRLAVRRLLAELEPAGARRG
jgi:predicted DNA-binding protein